MRYDVTLSADGRTEKRFAIGSTREQAAAHAFKAWGSGVAIIGCEVRHMVTHGGEATEWVYHGKLYGRSGFATLREVRP